MESPVPEDVEQIPAWVEEEFLQRIRRGSSVEIIAEFADRLPQMREQVTTYLQLLAFMERGRSLAESTVSTDHPETVGEFQIERQLGRGGMGTVYAARGPEGSQVAIKRLHPERSAQISRFRREAETIARLDHPSIVRLHSFHEGEAHPYLVMELIHGIGLDVMLQATPTYECLPFACAQDRLSEVDLRGVDLLRAGSFVAQDFSIIRQVALQIAAALAHTHALGIIHRDIKPANLIYGDDRRIRITDFGLAKPSLTFDTVTQTGDLIGTPRYMAPEQLRGFAVERSDIYSLGVTLWELCTGHAAWATPNDSQPHGWKLQAAQRLNPQVPTALSELISQCCAIDPQQRPTAAEVVQRLGDQHPAAHAHPGRWPRAALVGLGSLMVLLLALIPLWNPFSHPTTQPVLSNDDPLVNAPPTAAGSASSGAKSADDSGRLLEITARSGQTLFELRELLPLPEDQPGLKVDIIGGKDADSFRIDLNSQLCVQTPELCVADDTTGVLEVDVAVSGCSQPAWASIVEYGTDDVCLMICDGGEGQFFRTSDVDGLQLSRSIGLASADGRLFLTTVPAADGTVALWSFEIDENQAVSQAVCLNRNCGLPSGTEALTTVDGQTFSVVGYRNRTDYTARTASSDEPRQLWRMSLQSDGTFEQVSEQPLPLKTDRVSYLTMTESGVLRLGWQTGTVPVRGSLNRQQILQPPTAFGTRDTDHLAMASWPTPQESEQARFQLRIQPQRWDQQTRLSKSQLNGAATTVEFINPTDGPLSLFWIDQEGLRQYVTHIAADNITPVDSFVGHTLEVHSPVTQSPTAGIWAAFTVTEHMPPIRLEGPRPIPPRDY